MTYLSEKNIDMKVRRNVDLLLGIIVAIVLSASITFLIDCTSLVALHIQIFTIIGSFFSTAIILSIFIDREKYKQTLMNKLERLDRKIRKIENKRNIINDEITKVQRTQESKNSQYGSTQNIIISNLKSNTTHNRRLTINEKYDDDYRDDMSSVVDSLEEGKIIFKGIEEPHKVRKRTLK